MSPTRRCIGRCEPRSFFATPANSPIEIVGPDAERLLNKVFARDVSKVRVGRCSYQFACYHDGGMINDGVMLRLTEDRFWMAQADGDLLNWYRAHAVNDDGTAMDVQVFDPNV